MENNEEAPNKKQRRVEVGLLFFLVLLVFTMGDPMVHVGGLLRRLPSFDVPADIACMRQAIPEDARVLILSAADGTIEWNAYNNVIVKRQYDLVPRIIEYSLGGTVDFNRYHWFLAYGLDASQMATLSNLQHLQVVTTCGRATVLARGG